MDVRDAALRGVADHSRGALMEMRGASGGLHTVPSTLHRSSARGGQEGAEPATEITHNGSLVRTRSGEEITNLRLVLAKLLRGQFRQHVNDR